MKRKKDSFGLRLARRLFLGTKIFFKLALLLPIPIFMVAFSYKVDRSGLFQGDLAPRQVVDLLLEGKDVTNFEQMDERQIVRLYTQNLDPDNVPIAMGVGSSRVLQVTREVADTDSFFNLGVTGADVRDVMTSYYLCVKEGKIPQVLIWSVDPWVLYGSEAALDSRADSELYNEFLQQVLGIDTGYEEPDQVELWKALADPAYFQGNMEYYFRNRQGTLTDDSGQLIPFTEVQGDPYQQSATIKRSDGSVLYDVAFRSHTSDQILSDAIAQSETFNSLHMEGFTELGETECRAFDAFIRYAETQGTRVILLLTPFHPFLYDTLLSRAENYSGFFQVENWIRQYAEDTGTPLYGSYDPLILDGIKESDFYDGVHCTSEALEKFFPGIWQALEEADKGITPHVLSLKNRTTAAERISW